MYKGAVHTMIRRNIDALNLGRIDGALAMFAVDGELCFPGVNTWSSEFQGGRS